MMSRVRNNGSISDGNSGKERRIDNGGCRIADCDIRPSSMYHTHTKKWREHAPEGTVETSVKNLKNSSYLAFLLRHKSAAAYGAKQNKSEVEGKRNTNEDERITEEARKERKMHTIV
jgi:hypothetical protein